MSLELTNGALLAFGGLVAGFVNGTVGGGSLLTYPLLVASGLPPVISAATNTTGLSMGNAAALLPHLDGSHVKLGEWRKHAAAHASGALVGGSLLILLPEKVFEFLVPILLVVASLLTLRKPREAHHGPRPTRQTLARLVGSGVYQGYFGPGQGVIAVAVLLGDGRLNMSQVIVVKNFVIAASNLIVASLFILSGHVEWTAALVLLVTVSAGAWVGGSWAKGRSLPWARHAVAAVGFLSAAWFVFAR